MTKRYVIMTVSLIMSLALMIMIYCFSAESSAKSRTGSAAIVNAIAPQKPPAVAQIKDGATEEEIQEAKRENRQNLADWHKLASALTIIVRKSAHASEFAALGASLAAFFIAYGRLKCSYLVTLLICALYGAFDEVHQFFVPGRSTALSDALVDALGGAIGAAAVYLAVWLIRRRRQKRNKA